MRRVLTRMQEMLNNVIEQRNQSRSQNSSELLSESRLNEVKTNDSIFK